MSDEHDDTTCPHLFEAASLSAHLVEAETRRDDYKRAWQRDLEKGREFLAERDDAHRLGFHRRLSRLSVPRLLRHGDPHEHG